MTGRSWQPPHLHPAHVHEEDEDRKVSWLELFFDLVLVATVVQLGNILSEDVSLRGAFEFAALFVPIWWAWTGLTFYYNRFEVDDIWQRLLVFVQMFALGNMAITVPTVFGAGAVAFALCYVVLRAVLIVQYWRVWRTIPQARALARNFMIVFGLAASFWAVSVVVPAPGRYVLWTIGIVIDLLAPFWIRRAWTALPPDLPHVSERFGLLTIIVLGESFLKVVSELAGSPLILSGQVFGALAFVIVGSVWWTYFDDVAGAQIKMHTRWGRGTLWWLYAHLPLVVGITAIGVGITKLVVLDWNEPLASYYRWLLCGAIAVTLSAIAVLDLVTVRSDIRANAGTRAGSRIVAAVVVLALGAVGGALPPVALVTLIAATCVSQVLIDLWLEGGAEHREPVLHEI